MGDIEISRMGKYTSPDGSRTWEYLAIAACAIFPFSMGTTLGWISPTIIKLLEPESPIPFSPDDVSTMVAAGAAGSLIAPFVSNVMVDRIGRRKTLLLSGLPVIVSSAIIMAATRVWMIHVARVLVGYSLGMCLCVTPMYMGEVASTRTRGVAGAAIGVTLNLGVLLAYGLCPYVTITGAAAFLMAIGMIFLGTFWFMPETPYYLGMVGNFEDAELVLEKLRGTTNVSDELDLVRETMMPKGRHDHHQQQQVVRITKAAGVKKSGTLSNLLRDRVNRRALAIGLIFLVPQNFGGYFLLLNYAELIFRDAGMTIVPSHLATVAVGVSQLVSSIMAGFTVDRIGRRPMMLGAGIAATLANAVIGAYLYVKEHLICEVIDDYSVAFLIAVLIQVFSFNFGLLSIHMVIMSEIFATEVKGIGTTVVGVCGAVFSVITSKLYISMAITWGAGHSLIFLGFSIIVCISTIVMLRIIPETKGKTFLQIQRDLNNDCGQLICTARKR